MKKLPSFFLSLLLALSCCPAVTQALHDPTRPQTGGGSKAVVKAVPAQPPLPRLQMVLIGAERSTVVIDGEVLQVGEMFNGMQIETILPVYGP
jgi:hypothetical protein